MKKYNISTIIFILLFTWIISLNKIYGQLALENPTNRDAVRAALNINNVDNTSDANKPLSSFTNSALSLKVDLTSLSITGGSNNVPRLDANGNWTTGPFANDNIIGGPNGNIFIPDKRTIQFLRPDGSYGDTRIFNWHDHLPQELVIASENRIALGFRSTLQLGVNDSGINFPFNVELGAGDTTDANPTKESGLFSLRTLTQPTSDPGVKLKGRISFQAVPVSRSTQASTLKIWDQAVISGENGPGGLTSSTVGDVIGGTMLAEVSSEGLYSAGTAPTFLTLTPGDTITQTCSKFKTTQMAKVTLDRASSQLAFSGIQPGMRGILYVLQGAGNQFLVLPVASYKVSTFALSTSPGAIDKLTWDYDGASYYWDITKGLESAYDTDAQNFFTAAGISDSGQKSAVNNLVLSLKSASLWTRFDALYPFVGGVNTSHDDNLKGASYTITWAGTVTHNANGITGNGTDGRGDTGINFNALGRVNSVSGYVYSKSTDITASCFLFGATDSFRFGIIRGSAIQSLANGPNDSSNGTWGVNGITNWLGHHALNRSSSTGKEMYWNSMQAATTNEGSVGAVTNTINLFCREYNGPAYSGFSNATLAFAAFGQSLSSGEWTTFRAIIDTYQTALGRQN